MKIKVTDFETSIKDQFTVDHVIGLFDPIERDWCESNLNFRNRTMFWFNDTTEGTHAPKRIQIRNIVRKVKELGLLDKNIIVHCRAGIGRSTATAMALLIMSGKTIDEAISEIATQRPFMWPNELVAKHFDDELGLNGEFLKAVLAWKKAATGDDIGSKKLWIKQHDGTWQREDV